MGYNLYYQAVKVFFDTRKPGFEEFREYNGYSVRDALINLLNRGLKEELADMKMMEAMGSTIDEGSTIDGGEGDA